MFTKDGMLANIITKHLEIHAPLMRLSQKCIQHRTGVFSLCDSNDIIKRAKKMSRGVSEIFFFPAHSADELAIWSNT